MKNFVIRFAKMHGLGNDFMLIDAINQSFSREKLSIPKLADRHLGVGFDQLLFIEKSSRADFFCRIFNADGSEAEQCGNGLRCVARFIHEQQLINKNIFTIETKAGVFPVKMADYDHISVALGVPQIEKNSVDLTLSSSEKSIRVNAISLGNPHALIAVDNLQTTPVTSLGPEIGAHTFFSNGANVGFMQIINPHHILLRTFERGAGETLACGSNACAAVIAGILNHSLQSPVTVEFSTGKLCIEWDGETKPIQMTGPASFVYCGEITV